MPTSFSCHEVMSPASDLLNMSAIPSYSKAFIFPKLTGSNYVTWSIHMQSALRSHMLWLLVNGTETKLPKADENLKASEYKTARREWIEWMQKGKTAMGSILAVCEDLQYTFMNHRNGCELS